MSAVSLCCLQGKDISNIDDMAVLHLKPEFAHEGLKSDMGMPANKNILVVGGGGR